MRNSGKKYSTIMKTIEERAWEKYPEVIKHHNLVRIDINEKKRKMYIEIATEQKEIDIEKACVACESELRRLKQLINKSVDVPTNPVSVGKSLSRIRKEMYEDN